MCNSITTTWKPFRLYKTEKYGNEQFHGEYNNRKTLDQQIQTLLGCGWKVRQEIDELQPMTLANKIHPSHPQSMADAIAKHVTLGDDGTLDTVIEIGNRVLRFDQETTSPYRDEIGDLDLDHFFEDYAEVISDELSGVLDEWFDKFAEWEENYRSSHLDEGDNYAHLIKEGDIPVAMGRLKEYVADNWEDSHQINLDKLVDAFDLDDVEMLPGSVFGPCQSDGCVLESYPLQEIESEIDWSHVSESTGIPSEICAAWAQEGSSHCIRFWNDRTDYAHLYIATDAVWFCVATDETIQDAIDEIEGESVWGHSPL